MVQGYLCNVCEQYFNAMIAGMYFLQMVIQKDSSFGFEGPGGSVSFAVSEVHFLVHKMLDFRSFRPMDPLRPSA
jgi:hypothetical protein